MINSEGWEKILMLSFEESAVKMLCRFTTMFKRAYLSLVFGLGMTRACASDCILLIQAKGIKQSFQIELIESEEESSSNTNLLLGVYSYIRPWLSGHREVITTEELEMGGITYERLHDVEPERGTTATDLNESAACSEEAGACSIELLGQTERCAVVNQQPEALNSLHGRTIDTGSHNISAWLEDGSFEHEFQDTPVFQVPENRIEEFTRLMVRLLWMSSDQIKIRNPVCRMGPYVFDTGVNPEWQYGKWMAFGIGAATSGGAYAGFASGAFGLGVGALTTGAWALASSTAYFSATPFSDEYRVSFSFSWNSLPVRWSEISHLRQLANMLQCFGEYEFESSSLHSFTHRQNLTYRVRMPEAMGTEQIERLLQNLNQHYGNRFSVVVSSLRE